MNLLRLQNEVFVWTNHNFPNQQKWHPVLGLSEEVGELCHSYLKREQGIRVEEVHRDKIVDAVGDIVIFLCNFCNWEGIDLEKTVQKVWSEVKQRDWTKESPGKSAHDLTNETSIQPIGLPGGQA